jgi:hypothetical protein
MFIYIKIAMVRVRRFLIYIRFKAKKNPIFFAEIANMSGAP